MLTPKKINSRTTSTCRWRRSHPPCCLPRRLWAEGERERLGWIKENKVVLIGFFGVFPCWQWCDFLVRFRLPPGAVRFAARGRETSALLAACLARSLQCFLASCNHLATNYFESDERTNSVQLPSTDLLLASSYCTFYHISHLGPATAAPPSSASLHATTSRTTTISPHSQLGSSRPVRSLDS